MMMKWLLALGFFFSATVALASNSNEIQRLEEIRDAKINKCTSLECREAARNQFQASVNRLQASPGAYYNDQPGRISRSSSGVGSGPTSDPNCFGNCGSDQGVCIGQCRGNGQCISNCAQQHGRCVSRCR